MIDKLKSYGLTLENILKTSDEKLSNLIRGVNFRTKKVSYIKKVSKIIQEKYEGKVPYKLDD